MSLLTFEGFDWTQDEGDLIFDENSAWWLFGTASVTELDSSIGRYGGNAFKLYQYTTPNTLCCPIVSGGGPTFTVGFGVRLVEYLSVMPAGTYDWMALRHGDGKDGDVQVRIRYNKTTTKFEVWNDTVKLGETTSTYSDYHVWWYMELTVTVNATTGSYDLYVDDVLEDSDTSVDTQGAAGTDVDFITFHSTGAANRDYFAIDDVYVRDDTTRHGMTTRVSLLRPTADGATTDFVPLSGSNFQNVDDTPSPDDATTTNSSAVAGDIDTFIMEDLPAEITAVHGVRVDTRSTRDIPVPTGIASVVRTASTDYAATAETLNDVWSNRYGLWEDNPNTAGAWTPAAVNGLECGYKHAV